MERFSKEQLLLGNLIRSLISLHYLQDKGGNQYAPETISGIKDILKQTAGDFRFDKSTRSFVRGHYSIGTDESQLVSFRKIMDGLSEAIADGVKYHFSLKGVRNETDTTIERKDNVLKRATVKMEVPEDIVNETVIASIINKGEIHRTLDDVIIRTINYRFFNVDDVSKFGNDLLRIEPREDPIYIIPSIDHQSWTSFVQIIRSILVHFHVSFGNFERIKTCESCEHLFFEERKGRRMFCSALCKKHHIDSQESKEKRLCRERQNAWMRKKTSDSFRITKSDCGKCYAWKSTGNCQHAKKYQPKCFKL